MYSVTNHYVDSKNPLSLSRRATDRALSGDFLRLVGGGRCPFLLPPGFLPLLFLLLFPLLLFLFYLSPLQFPFCLGSTSTLLLGSPVCWPNGLSISPVWLPPASYCWMGPVSASRRNGVADLVPAVIASLMAVGMAIWSGWWLVVVEEVRVFFAGFWVSLGSEVFRWCLGVLGVSAGVWELGSAAARVSAAAIRLGFVVADAVMVLVVMAASGRRWGGGQRCCWMLTGCLVEGRTSRSPGQQQGLVPRVSGVGVAAARPFTSVRGVRLRGALAAWGFDLLWGCGQQQGGWRRLGVC
ncbi:hypothetical protein RHMOL_Rhmol06G0238800 [Rhododendron molle]|uniref:Uncharacterized protein n=1 Tax=Rhododendron molle TaxID=49168 RepID=A0ACC0NGA2_RHOML|nr:hypothetical protein RHMOL_Rhmol06G0238800 [Rhododendron molle]